MNIAEKPADSIRHLLMPAFTLGLALTATITRQVRSSLLEVLQDDFVRTARAKGIRELWVVVRHALRNALLPVVTVMGLQLGRLLGGTVVIETVFSLPGLGRLATQSILNRDYVTLQGVVIVVTVAVLVIHLLTDLCYAYLDPRISYRGAT